MPPAAAREDSALLRLLRWVLLLGLVAVLALLGLPADWPARVLAVERPWYLGGLGAVTGAAVLEQAEHWSGGAWSGSSLAGRAADDARWLSDWGAGRLTLLAGLRELLLLRLALLAAWAPALVLVLIAAVLDGYWRWRIRQCGFDYPSPIGRRASATGVGLLLLVVILALGLPLALPPGLVPLALGLCAALIGAGIRHLPKQL